MFQMLECLPATVAGLTGPGSKLNMFASSSDMLQKRGKRIGCVFERTHPTVCFQASDGGGLKRPL